MDLTKIRNIGIAAHIDSGKTTVSERILFYTGKIHKIIEVRSKGGGGPTMDSMELEREKGITIQSAATHAEWKGHAINLIDTPGHIDFTVEVERALRVLDGAVLVLCGVGGVQSQSITVDRQMKRYGVPRVAFINKVDRSGANPDRVCTQLEEKLYHKPVLITMPIGLEENFEGVVDLVEMKAIYYRGEQGEKIEVEDIPEHLQEEAETRRDTMIERLADYSDDIAEKFLEGETPAVEEIKKALKDQTIGMKITPVLVGTAKMNKGIQTLLDAVIDYLPNPAEVTNEALDLDNNEETIILESDASKKPVALAFKLEDGRFGQLTYMRIYQGTINKGDFITNVVNGKKVKVPRLVRMHASEMQDVEVAEAGDIVAMFGVDCASGDTFTDGELNYSMTSMFVAEPVIELSVKPKERSGQVNFSKAMNRFQKEDPTFRVYRDEESGETIMCGMGELHLDVYLERIKREYNTEIIVGQPKVAYREAITKTVEYDYTHKKQSGGSGQYGRVAGFIEPMPAVGEETYEFCDEIVGGVIPREYIPAVDRGFQKQLSEGVLIGQPIVGIKAHLNDGSTHAVDSSDMAFQIAGQAAMREAIRKAAPVVLEPIMSLEVSAPEEFQGVVIGQLNQRRGVIQDTQLDTGYVTITSEVPLKEMFGYSSDLRSVTQGKGEFTMEFQKYSQVPKSIQEEIIKEYEEAKEEESK